MFWLKLILLRKFESYQHFFSPILSHIICSKQHSISNQNNWISSAKKKYMSRFYGFSIPRESYLLLLGLNAILVQSVGLIRFVCCVFSVFLVHQHDVVLVFFFARISADWWTLIRFAIAMRSSRETCTRNTRLEYTSLSIYSDLW